MSKNTNHPALVGSRLAIEESLRCLKDECENFENNEADEDGCYHDDDYAHVEGAIRDVLASIQHHKDMRKEYAGWTADQRE
jgi:hypothetical protein